MKAITQTLGIIALLLLAVFALPVHATLDSLGVSITDVKLNGDSLNANQAVKTDLTRDNTASVKVQFQTDNATSASDVQVSVFLTGSKDSISDTSKPFNVVPNTIYTKTFSLDLPQRLKDRQYQLRVVIASPNSKTVSFVYPLLVDAVDHSIAIKEVTFSPNGAVMAGRAMTAVARLRNYGAADEQDVKVVFSIPELGIQETDYVNQVDKDESVSTQEVLLRIPANAKAGDYTVNVVAYYDDYDLNTKVTNTISVTGNTVAQASNGVTGQTVISVGPQSQSVARGENGVIYPLTLSNTASVAKTFTLSVAGTADWATSRISPSNVIVLNAGETKQAYVYVAANENAAVGQHVFSVNVQSGNDVVQQIPMTADVVEGASSANYDGVKKALLVGIVLLVVLVVVLGVVIAYRRNLMNGKAKDETAEIAQTYY